jgi:hypothetical protein
MIDLSAGDRLLCGIRQFRHRTIEALHVVIANQRDLFGNGQQRACRCMLVKRPTKQP